MKLKRNYVVRIFPVLFGIAGAGIPFEYAMADGDGKANEAESMLMTKNVVSRDSIEQSDPQDGFEALKNVAGVTNSNSRGTISDNINIRGIPLSFSTSYRINGGLPINNVLGFPIENKERIEALKGANALMFGIASPAGIVNLVTKRATDVDVSTLTLSGNAFGQYMTSADIGRKFGEDKQFGIRVNGALGHLETGVDGGSGRREFLSVAADWKANDSLTFKLDAEQLNRKVVEQSTIFQLKPVNGIVPLPRIPDPTKLLSGPWAIYDAKMDNILANVEYKIAKDWKVTAEAGRGDSERVARDITRISNYDLVTGVGTEAITLVRNQDFLNKYGKLEVNGKLITGPLRHELTFGIMSSERDANGPSSTGVNVVQNIYNPISLAAPRSPAPLTYLPQQSKDVGIYAYDTISVGRNWQFLGGVRETNYKADNAVAGRPNSVTETHSSSPAVGIVYNFSRNTAVYASFMKGLEETGVAPVGTVNQFQILAPAEATQTELGIRSVFDGVTLNAAIFDIKRANTVTDRSTNIFLIDGTTKFQGLEANANYDITPQWSVSAGGQAMHAVQNSLIDKTINGLAPENTPKLTGNVSVTHRSKIINGLTLTAGTLYTGPRWVNPQNQGHIPGVALFTIGAGYLTKIGGHRTTFGVNIDNVTDKRYWSSASNGALGVGMVRSIKLNSKIDF